MNNTYNKEPEIAIPCCENEVWRGYGPIAEQIRARIAGLAKAVVVVECYPGVRAEEIKAGLGAPLGAAAVFDAEEAALDKAALDALGSERVLAVTADSETYPTREMEEAVRIARLARAAGVGNWIKVEVSVADETLLPDPVETLKATEQLAKEGFVVLPYTSDDPVLCQRLEEAGAAAIMPGGSPIGTGLGILNPYNLERIVMRAKVPVIVDAGIGSPSDAALALELGASAVLVNTAIAKAKDPVAMARAFKLAVEAGRAARLAGRIPKKPYATASSGLEWLVSRSHAGR